jgi:hypothetical protein
MASKKKPPRKKAVKAKTSANRATKNGLYMDVPHELEARLEDLAKSMGKSMDQMLTQALIEFADTWEDHQRVVETLNEDDDRMQIVVGKD